ncbi:MAG: helix-turn-helix domain-containing protein [Actinomycetota bacterium]
MDEDRILPKQMLDQGSLTSDRLGPILRAARVERGLATEEVAWQLKVRPEVIRTLERRDPAALPDPAIVRAQLASYSRLLDLDERIILSVFDEAVGDTGTAVKALDEQARSVRLPPRARWILAAAISLLALLIAALAGVLGTESEPIRTGEPPPTGTAIDAASATIRLELRSLQPTDLAVTVDGEEVFEGRLPEGKQRTFRARSELKIVAADGGAIRIEVNGKPVDTGEPGAVFSAVFGPGGRRL